MRAQAMTILALALLGGMALVASGCGGGSATTTTTTTTKAPTGPTPGLGLTAKSCLQLVNLPVTFTNATTGLPSNVDEVLVVLKRFARTAPFEIRPDFQSLAANTAKVVSILKGVDLNVAPTPATIVKLRRLSTDVDTTAVTDSAASISAWAFKNCPGTRSPGG
jgi:hypothetical protein